MQLNLWQAAANLCKHFSSRGINYEYVRVAAMATSDAAGRTGNRKDHKFTVVDEQQQRE